MAHANHYKLCVMTDRLMDPSADFIKTILADKQKIVIIHMRQADEQAIRLTG